MTFDRRSAAAAARAIGFAVLIAATSTATHGQSPPAGQVATPDAAADIESLKSDLEALHRLVPDQAHIMADVDYHFANLWFAARNRNWPLAEFYIGEVRSHLTWAVRARPVRKLSSGADLELPPILIAVLSGGVTDIKNAVDKQDGRAFEAAYRGMMAQCYGCHVAIEKPYLRLHIPESPATRMIDVRGEGGK